MVPSFSGLVGYFFRPSQPEDKQANGLYVLAGLYLLDQYYLYSESRFTDSFRTKRVAFHR